MASILAQTYPQQRVFWRDDGSTDNTVPYLQQHFGIQPLDIAPLGITASYRRLLDAAYDAGCDLFAFADQDDVWAINKIAVGVRAIQDVPEPALYCARQTLVDANLRRIGASPLFYQPIGFPAALTQNIATGCTIMLNRAAAALVLQTLDCQRYHDWWCYIIIAAAGGRIITDNTEVLQYRQHSNNVIGAPASAANRVFAAVRRGPRRFMDVFRSHVDALQHHHRLIAPCYQNDLAMIHAALRHGARWRALRLPGFHRQTRKEDLLFRLWFLIG